MLRSLHISNYILIDSLDISFPGGLIIITGQTGAGKSILLGAVSLLLGAKADASVIRPGAGSCVVEAVFETSDSVVRELLEEFDIECEGGLVTIRRVVYPSGRSRSFVNECPSPVPLLGSIGGRLIDIHSQHQSLLLTDKSYQLSVLDAFAGNAGLLSQCSLAYSEVCSLESELSALDKRIDDASEEHEYKSARLARLEAARLQVGELESLEAEQKMLAGAGEIASCVSAIQELESPSVEEVPGVSASLKEASRLLARLSRYIPSAEELSQRLSQSRLELEDIFGEVARLGAGLDASPARLEAVEQRMGLIYDLMRRYGCNTVEELIAKRDALASELGEDGSLQERRADVLLQLSSAREKLSAIAGELHSARVRAAAPFAARINDSLKFLELENSVFEVSLEEGRMGAAGADRVEFRFDAAGRRPADLASCASGGELSRIMLCLKSLMAEYSQMPTMVFDEIDSGVSGSVAAKMGSMICGMGAHMQVIAITHLPQVAAKGGVHFLVSKTFGADGASTDIRRIEGDARVQEIARMLSGESITPAAVANARELLGARP